MKCRVTFEYTEEDARAVANHYGWGRPATHEEMRNHFERYGNSAMDDFIYELRNGRAFRGDAA